MRKLSLIILLLFMQNGISQEEKPRLYYNAKNEPLTGVLHGSGQDIYSFINYSDSVGKESMPVIYMT